MMLEIMGFGDAVAYNGKENMIMILSEFSQTIQLSTFRNMLTFVLCLHQ